MFENHPIEGLMKTAMDSIKDMIDVNTIIGNPIKSSNDVTIIPISKVCFGFASGGSEFNSGTINEYKRKKEEEESKYKLPFGGGSGAAVNITPIAFVIISGENVKVLPIDHASSIDKLLDYLPDLMDKFDKKAKKGEEKNEPETEKSTVNIRG